MARRVSLSRPCRRTVCKRCLHPSAFACIRFSSDICLSVPADKRIRSAKGRERSNEMTVRIQSEVCPQFCLSPPLLSQSRHLTNAILSFSSNSYSNSTLLTVHIAQCSPPHYRLTTSEAILVLLLNRELRKMSQGPAGTSPTLQTRYDTSVQEAMRRIDALQGDLKTLFLKHSEVLKKYHKQRDQYEARNFNLRFCREGTREWDSCHGYIREAKLGMESEEKRLNEIGPTLQEKLERENMELYTAVFEAAAFGWSGLSLTRPARWNSLLSHYVFKSITYMYWRTIEARARVYNPHKRQWLHDT